MVQTHADAMLNKSRSIEEKKWTELQVVENV